MSLNSNFWFNTDISFDRIINQTFTWLELNDISDVKDCDVYWWSLELEKNINELVPTIEWRLVFDLKKKSIGCPLNGSMDKYLKFSPGNRIITPCNLRDKECKRIEDNVNPFLIRLKWSIKKDKLWDSEKKSEEKKTNKH